MSVSVFSQLPNDLIIRIIRETKSSVDFKREHEEVWDEISYQFWEIQDYEPFEEASEFFNGFELRGNLTPRIKKYRNSQEYLDNNSCSVF